MHALWAWNRGVFTVTKVSSVSRGVWCYPHKQQKQGNWTLSECPKGPFMSNDLSFYLSWCVNWCLHTNEKYMLRCRFGIKGRNAGSLGQLLKLLIKRQAEGEREIETERERCIKLIYICGARYSEFCWLMWIFQSIFCSFVAIQKFLYFTTEFLI